MELLIGGSVLTFVVLALFTIFVADPAGNYMTVQYGKLFADLKLWVSGHRSPTPVPTFTESATVSATPTVNSSPTPIETPISEAHSYPAISIRLPTDTKVNCEIVPLDINSRKFLPYLDELIHQSNALTPPTCQLLLRLDLDQPKISVGSCPIGGWADVATVHYEIHDAKHDINREGSVDGKPHCDNSDIETDHQAAFIAAMAEFAEVIAQ